MTDKWKRIIKAIGIFLGFCIFWSALIIVSVWLLTGGYAHAQPARDSQYAYNNTVYGFEDIQDQNDTLITYVDGADLQRQVREIRAVCDTSWADTVDGQFGLWNEEDSNSEYGAGLTHEYSGEYRGRHRFIMAKNLENDKQEIQYIPPIIRCRTQVQVIIIPGLPDLEIGYAYAVVDTFGSIGRYLKRKQEALITWEWE